MGHNPHIVDLMTFLLSNFSVISKYGACKFIGTLILPHFEIGLLEDNHISNDSMSSVCRFCLCAICDTIFSVKRFDVPRRQDDFSRFIVIPTFHEHLSRHHAADSWSSEESAALWE